MRLHLRLKVSFPYTLYNKGLYVPVVQHRNLRTVGVFADIPTTLPLRLSTGESLLRSPLLTVLRVLRHARSDSL